VSARESIQGWIVGRENHTTTLWHCFQSQALHIYLATKQNIHPWNEMCKKSVVGMNSFERKVCTCYIRQGELTGYFHILSFGSVALRTLWGSFFFEYISLKELSKFEYALVLLNWMAFSSTCFEKIRRHPNHKTHSYIGSLLPKAIQYGVWGINIQRMSINWTWSNKLWNSVLFHTLII